jgi:GntR family transcriptional regulator, transcriptional repressor for pyruvate dehydrogenase complex
LTKSPAARKSDIPTTSVTLRPGASLSVRPVRKAYQQAADQIRDLILTGELQPGSRLPNETMMALNFGISRATVREALRVLAAQNLIRTTKGTGGGSFVTLPTVDHISEFLGASLGLMTEARDVSLEELLDARALLEIPAAYRAAQRRDDDDVKRLLGAIPDEPLKLHAADQFTYNKEFHSVVLETSRNKLLLIAAQPIFSVLQTHLARSVLGRPFHRTINEHHREITAAIAAGDPVVASDLMETHLDFLRPAYEKAWRHSFRSEKVTVEAANNRPARPQSARR